MKYMALVNTISAGWLGHAILREVKDQSRGNVLSCSGKLMNYPVLPLVPFTDFCCD